MWPTILLLMTGFAGGVIFIVLAEMVTLSLMLGLEATPDEASLTRPANLSQAPFSPPEPVYHGYQTGAVPHTGGSLGAYRYPYGDL